MSEFPSMKGRRLLAVLMREPLGYRIAHQTGSHKILRAPGRPQVVLGWHDGQELGGSAVRKTLVKDVGLEEAEALDLL